MLQRYSFILNNPNFYEEKCKNVQFWSFLLTFDLLPIFSYFCANFAGCMKKYSIEVMEILSRVVDVEAVDENDAIERVRQMYRKCQIVLDDSDYKETEISVKDEKSE